MNVDMRKEDVSLVNQILIEMRKLADSLNDCLNKQDFEGVLKIKRQIGALQKRMEGLL